jgi:hypothetical protein
MIKATITIPQAKRKHFEELIQSIKVDKADAEYRYLKELMSCKQPSWLLAGDAHKAMLGRRRLGQLMKEPLYSTAYTIAIQRELAS